MLHLLDANVLITANRLYYPLERVPEFWDWLVHQGETGNVKMPLEMVEEITGSADNLSTWLSEKANLDALLLDEDTDVALVRRVTNEGYAPDLTDVEIEKIGRDPFVSKRWLGPTEFQLDGVKFHGRSSSIRLFG